MIRAHVDAVLGLLKAVPNLTVYDAMVPDSPQAPYVVVYPDQGAAQPTSFTLASDQRLFRVQTTSVGSDPQQARWVAEKTQGALLDATPAVAGRTTWPIRHELTRPIERDDDVSPPMFYAVDLWRVLTVPA